MHVYALSAVKIGNLFPFHRLPPCPLPLSDSPVPNSQWPPSGFPHGPFMFILTHTDWTLTLFRPESEVMKPADLRLLIDMDP